MDSGYLFGNFFQLAARGLEVHYRSGHSLHNNNEVREHLEKEYPDCLRALAPAHINAPADY